MTSSAVLSVMFGPGTVGGQPACFSWCHSHTEELGAQQSPALLVCLWGRGPCRGSEWDGSLPAQLTGGGPQPRGPVPSGLAGAHLRGGGVLSLCAHRIAWCPLGTGRCGCFITCTCPEHCLLSIHFIYYDTYFQSPRCAVIESQVTSSYSSALCGQCPHLLPCFPSSLVFIQNCGAAVGCSVLRRVLLEQWP